MQRTLSTKARTTLLAAGFILSGIVSLLLSMLVQPPVLLDEMQGGLYRFTDIYDPLDYAHGLYAPETAPDGTTFRWAGQQASLTFPYAANLGRHARVSLRMANWAAQASVSATITLNGRPNPPITLDRAYQIYTFPLDTAQNPGPNLDPSHVQVDIETPTILAPDGRQLGAAIDWIEIKPERSRTEIAIEAAVWAILMTLVVWIALARFGVGWSLILGLLALSTFGVLHLTYLPRGIPPPVELALAGLATVLAVRLVSRARPLWAIALAACGLWLVVAGRLMGDWQMDDAYISYRYAWNFVQGNGLVYNAGEVVEGYTNFLWTLLASAALAFNLHPPAVMLVANIALAIGLVSLTYFVGRRMSQRETVWPLIAAGLVASDGAVVTYGARGSGMEAIGFAFLVLLAAALIWLPQGKNVRALYALGGATLALASLLRPEGLLAAAIFICVRAWQCRKDRACVSTLLAILIPFLAIVVPYQIWRISFYGYPFPNTFYAKTGATAALVDRGGEYVSVFLGERWLLMALALFGIVLLVVRRRLTELSAALALFSVVYLLYVVWAGGDHFPGWRFLVPVVAPLTLLAQDAAQWGWLYIPARSKALRNAAVMLGLLIGAYAVQALWLQEPHSVIGELTKLHTAYVNRWGSSGLWLKENTPPGTLTAAKGAGAIAFYSERPVLDVYGLNDLYIGHLEVATMGEGNPGHDKQDPVYVLSKRPDYILDEWLNYFQPVKGQLKQEYEYEVHRAPTGQEVAWWHLKAALGR